MKAASSRQITSVSFPFPNGRGHTLRGVLYVPQRYSTAVVLLHGFPGDSSGRTDRRARELARAGYLALRFDFTGCGASDGKHEERLMSGDLKDTRAAIDALQRHAEFDRLVVLGHSTGAVDAALYASTDARVDAVILVAGVADLERSVAYEFTPLQVRDFRTRCSTTTSWPLDWLGKPGRIDKAFYDEFFTLDIAKALKRFRKPVLIVHGEKDEAVPVAEAHALYAIANTPKRLVIIPGADHRFTRGWRAHMAALTSFLRSPIPVRARLQRGR